MAARKEKDLNLGSNDWAISAPNAMLSGCASICLKARKLYTSTHTAQAVGEHIPTHAHTHTRTHPTSMHTIGAVLSRNTDAHIQRAHTHAAAHTLKQAAHTRSSENGRKAGRHKTAGQI